MLSNLGVTVAGSFLETLLSTRRPPGSWGFMSGPGMVGFSVPRTMSYLPMRKQVFKPVCAEKAPCPPDPINRCALNMNTYARGPGRIWRPGTYTVPRSLAVVKAKVGSLPSTDSSTRSCHRNRIYLLEGCFGSWIADLLTDSIERLHKQWPTIVPVHLPIHASWLNQIEIYFSIVQRKVLTPNDFSCLAEVEERLLHFQERYQQVAQPFEWKFTRADLARLLKKLDSKPVRSHAVA